MGDVGQDGEDGEDGLSPWFTLPGVLVTVEDLTMSATSAVVSFQITDPAGVPLDRAGRLTQSQVTMSFVLGQLAEDAAGEAEQYTAYTTRIQTSPITGDSAVQGTTENSGTFETIAVAEGRYRYTFAAPLTGFDPALTQTVLAIARRTIDGVTATDRQLKSARPSGGTPIARSVVGEASCQNCHGELEGHGGRYNAVDQCVLCHSPQTTDPDTGNTVDFEVMVHRIHRGAELPSVEAGTPYQIIGNNQSLHDYSTVHYPVPNTVQNCASCHAGAAQADAWRERPADASCRSCHDNISFTTPVPAGQVLHCGGTQPPDAPCAVCHPASGSLAGITEMHALREKAAQLEIDILDVPATVPGAQPEVTFQVTFNGAPRDILTQPLSSLRATIAGPNTDYASYWQTTAQGSGASGTLVAVDAASGIFKYTVPVSAAIPLTATGSYTFGIEGYVTGPVPPPQVCAAAPPSPTSGPRWASVSPTVAFAVTDDDAIPRRQIIDPAKCDSCHDSLSFHGGGRKGGAYCTLCHNPNNANDERVSRFESSTVLAESVDLRVMIHKIHFGEHLSQPYVLGGNPSPSTSNPAGSPVTFDHLRYPRDPAACTACHADGTWELPLVSDLPSTLLEMTCTEDPLADTDSYCTNPFWAPSDTIRLPPETSACTSCHDQPYVAAHAAVNTTLAGEEACATCHGPGAAYDATVVHGL
jgi:OmcA/MtrC family decaheme c-type cytochrome